MTRALVILVVLAIVAALGVEGYHSELACIGSHCGVVFVRGEGR